MQSLLCLPIELRKPVCLPIKLANAVLAPLQNGRLATSSHTGAILIWADLAVVNRLLGHTHPVKTLVSANEFLLSTAHDESRALLWNAETGQVLTEIPLTEGVCSVDLFWDERVAVAFSSGFVYIVDTSGEVCESMQVDHEIHTMTTFGDFVITSSVDGKVKNWAGQKCIKVFQAQGTVTCFSAVEAGLFAVGTNQGVVHVWGSTIEHTFTNHTAPVLSITEWQNKIVSCSVNEICIWGVWGDETQTIPTGSTCLAYFGDRLAASGAECVLIY